MASYYPHPRPVDDVLRITGADQFAKAITAYLLALPTLVLLLLAGASLGVRLSANHWPELAGLLLFLPTIRS
jgi:hypothetical protein